MRGFLKNMGPYPRLLLIFLLPFFFFPLIAGKTGGPSVQWENTALDAAARINSGAFGTDPYLIHPPGYLYLLSFFVPPGGGALESARLFNYACFVLTGWMVFLLGRRLSPSGAAGGGGRSGPFILHFPARPAGDAINRSGGHFDRPFGRFRLLPCAWGKFGRGDGRRLRFQPLDQIHPPPFYSIGGRGVPPFPSPLTRGW